MIDYAKLMRKRDKAAGPDGKPPNIDLEMLRASTRMADNSNREANKNSNNTSGNNSNGNQAVSANTALETKPAPSSPSQRSDSTRPSPTVSKTGPQGPQTPASPATGPYHSNPSGPGVPPQQQPPRATQMMPPPSIASGTGDAVPPTWPAARGYPAEHGPFMRPHVSQSHTRGAPQ